MQNDINPEAVAIGVATELSKSFLTSAIKNVSKASKITFQKYFPNFEKHLAEIYVKNKCVKILCSKDTPIDFEELHVSSIFSNSEQKLSDKEIVDLVKKNQRIVISANGGAGKTFLMRYIWLSLFKEGENKVPIFVELRNLNKLSTYNLLSFIRASAFGADEFSEEAFKHFSQDGAFVFILDGFDEVERDKRPELEAQIIELGKKYLDCGLIVSGRPDDRFDGWQAFSTYKAEPFDYERFKSLVKKVPFDNSVKTDFTKIATPDFFKKHESFLSNPLLAIMMLMTFRDNAEIPTRLNVFYDNCYATLYSRHDALKEAYRRKKHLDQTEFKRAFSVFCLFSYIDDKFTLDADEFVQYVEKTRKYLNIKLNQEDIQHDFIESVNLLVKEGTNYSFIHRSFQEYFSAFCVTNVVTEKVPELLSLFGRRHYDTTFKLAYEIHAGLVQSKFLLPTYSKLVDKSHFPTDVVRKNPFNALEKTCFKLTMEIFLGVHKHKSGRRRGVGVARFKHDFVQDFESFLFSSQRALLNKDGAQSVTDGIFNFFDQVIRGVSKAVSGGFNVAPDVSGTLEITFSGNECLISLDYSKVYKRLPSGHTKMITELSEVCRVAGRKFNSSLLKAMQEIETEMEKLIQESEQQEETLSDFFDV